eukprot:4140611-Amphidinium_carterae.2
MGARYQCANSTRLLEVLEDVAQYNGYLPRLNFRSESQAFLSMMLARAVELNTTRSNTGRNPRKQRSQCDCFMKHLNMNIAHPRMCYYPQVGTQLAPQKLTTWIVSAADGVM